MKKRVLALLLAATMVFGLAACGGSDSGDTADNATVTDDAGTDDAADAEDTDAAQTDDAADTETEADTTTASCAEQCGRRRQYAASLFRVSSGSRPGWQVDSRTG